MTVAECISPDELAFARYACLKLLRTLQGALSIGVSSLLTGVPEPKAFFEERAKVLMSLATVLTTIAVKSTTSKAHIQLRASAERVVRAMDSLCQALISLAGHAHTNTFQSNKID